jgi:PAS domain-containing protein
MNIFHISDKHISNFPKESNGFYEPLVQKICENYQFLSGKPILTKRSASFAQDIYQAPFALLAHTAERDPRFVYANEYALSTFCYTWRELIGKPSRLSAEAPDRQERQRLLNEVSEKGIVHDYSGIRITSDGVRFVISEATVWNVVDERAGTLGQAAMFVHSRVLSKERIDWQNVSTFPEKTSAQAQLKRILSDQQIFEKLQPYSVACVSSILVEFDLPGSDVDIICQFQDRDEYVEDLRCSFSHYASFSIRCENQIVICTFEVESRTIEIYASQEEVSDQHGMKHIRVHERLAQLGGDRFCQKIRELKELGLKTEPAVARLLNLSGDPYKQVAELGVLSDGELFSRICRVKL